MLVNVGVGCVGVIEGVNVEVTYTVSVGKTIGAGVVGVVGIKIVYEHAESNRLKTGMR